MKAFLFFFKRRKGHRSFVVYGNANCVSSLPSKRKAEKFLNKKKPKQKKETPAPKNKKKKKKKKRKKEGKNKF